MAQSIHTFLRGTAMADSPASAPAGKNPPTSGGSVVRMLVLFGILVLAVSAWYYDHSVAGPASDQKYDAILKMVDEKNAKAILDGGIVTSKDVSDVVGFGPTYVEQKADHTIEWYCWWGKIPGLSTWKRYITVIYVGEPRRFNSHYKNEPPPQESLPNYFAVAKPGAQNVAEPATAPEQAAPGGASAEQSNAGEGGKASTKPAAGASEGDTAPKAEDQPKAETKPASDKAADEKPADEKPAGAKPATEKPVE
jgi:hypothetical protein